MILKKSMVLAAIGATALFGAGAMAQERCTGPNLHKLLETDLSTLEKVKQAAAFARAMGGAEVYAFYQDEEIKAITARFESDAGGADMNFFLENKTDYLMEYHIVQNSNFYGEPDSVLLTDEKSYYHICDDELLAPAFGGIINDDIFQNMKLVLNVILTEADAN